MLGLQFSNTNENVKWWHFVAQMTCDIETLLGIHFSTHLQTPLGQLTIFLR